MQVLDWMRVVKNKMNVTGGDENFGTHQTWNERLLPMRRRFMAHPSKPIRTENPLL